MLFGFTGFPGGFAAGARRLFFASLLTLVVLDPGAASAGQTQAPTMTKEELKGLLGKPDDLVVIDVRIEEQWKFSNRKIPGAVHENPAVPDSWIDKLPRDKTIVLYCA